MTSQLASVSVKDDNRLNDLSQIVISGRAEGGALTVTLKRDSDKPEDNPFSVNYTRRLGGIFDSLSKIELTDNDDKHAVCTFGQDDGAVDFFSAKGQKIDTGTYARTGTMTKRVDAEGKSHDVRDIRIDVTNLITFVSRKPQKASRTSQPKETAVQAIDREIADVQASLAACNVPGVKVPDVVVKTFTAQLAALTERRAIAVKKAENLAKARDNHATQPAAPVVSPGNNVVDASRKSASETRKSAHKPA